MAKRRAARRSGGGKKAGGGKAIYWVGGSVLAAGVGIAIYESTKKPAVVTTTTDPAISTTGPISSPSPTIPTTVSTPSSNGLPLGLHLPDTGGGGYTIVGTPPPTGAPTVPAVATPSYTVSNPNAPRVIHIAFPGSWKLLTLGKTYPANTHMRMEWATPPNGWDATIKSTVANNTFGAWSVTVYPPGANIPADWPGSTDPAWRLDFYTNAPHVVPSSAQSFGLPTIWAWS